MTSSFTNTFNAFFESEKAGGLLLIACTIFSLVLANLAIGDDYLHLWHFQLAGLSVEQWVNDGLMAVFFLLIGLELERELYSGELSSLKSALLPIFAAIGGGLRTRTDSFQFEWTSANARWHGDPDGDRYRLRPWSACTSGKPRAFVVEGVPRRAGGDG
jgi:hypothetical protein